MTAGGDPGQHPFHDDLGEEVISGERVPRRGADLTGTITVPVPHPMLGLLGVLRADQAGELPIEQGTKHGHA